MQQLVYKYRGEEFQSLEFLQQTTKNVQPLVS
jgi:hypothetical protein